MEMDYLQFGAFIKKTAMTFLNKFFIDINCISDQYLEMERLGQNLNICLP